MANDSTEDLKNSNGKRPAPPENPDLDELIQENGKHCNGCLKIFHSKY